MTGRYRRRRGAALLIAFCALPAGGEEPAADLRDVADHELPPQATHEECVALAVGDRLLYRFTSSVPVAFGIHYRTGHADVAPISRDAVAEDAGVFAPVLGETYCLRWSAGAEGAEIRYRMRVQRGDPAGATGRPERGHPSAQRDGTTPGTAP
ncbi:MAG TPA: hypothetical protein VLW08_01300 [Casimicrobiaceae bacterium]|jgi:hypothetical protein|nr:hypothetical protein [Casimicrobiaceae bacterium]